MGACESKDSSALVIDETILRDIETKIKKRLQNQVNDSNKAVAQKQNITIREKSTGDSRYYNNKTVDIKKGPFGIFGQGKDCPVYGCGYDIDQSTAVRLTTFNENLSNETENIWKDIKTELKKKSRKDLSSSARGSFDRAIGGASNLVRENIRTNLENISRQTYDGDQNIVIEYETPPRCSDPCELDGRAKGPKINQHAVIQIHSKDLLNSSLKIVEKKLADHEIDVENVAESGDDECIVQLLIIGLVSFVCILLTWKIVKKISNKRSGRMSMDQMNMMR